MLSPHPFPSENWCCRTAVLSVASSDNKQGRFDSTKFSEGCRFRKLGAMEPLRFPHMRAAKGVSIAPTFLKGVASENVLLSEPLRLPDLKTAVR